MVCLSVYKEAVKAADEHKWLQSEKAGHDLGQAAVREWSTSYWLQFYRWRFVQHLRGEILWMEFDRQAFGLLGKRFGTQRRLLDEILDRIRDGAENLNLIVWAHDLRLPMDQVISILEALDINSQRLAPPGDSDLSQPPYPRSS